MTLDRRKLEERIQSAFDGELDEAGGIALASDLAASREALDLYCGYAVMESTLHRYAREAHHYEAPRGIPRWRPWLQAGLSAAAVVVLSFAAWKSFSRAASGTGVESFALSPGSIVSGESFAMVDAKRLGKGERVQLKQGVAEFSLPSGVKAVIEGPAVFRVAARDRVELESGHSWFRVPAAARGFRVESPELEVVDLGTEFGVDLREGLPAEVHVLEGRVSARSKRGIGETRELHAGEAVRQASGGTWEPLAAEKDAFRRELPAHLPYLTLDFDRLDHDRFSIGGDILDGARARAVLKGSARLVPGVKGSALEFDGASSIETTWPGVAGSGPRTVALWCRVPAGARMETVPPLAVWGDPSRGMNSKFKIGLMTDGAGATRMRGSFGERLANGTKDLADGSWHHLAAVYRGNDVSGEPRLEFYIDGRPDAITLLHSGSSEAHTDVEGSGSLPMSIGKYELPVQGRNPYLKAAIDDFRIVAGALSPEEIARLAERP